MYEEKLSKLSLILPWWVVYIKFHQPHVAIAGFVVQWIQCPIDGEISYTNNKWMNKMNRVLKTDFMFRNFLSKSFNRNYIQYKLDFVTTVIQRRYKTVITSWHLWLGFFGACLKSGSQWVKNLFTFTKGTPLSFSIHCQVLTNVHARCKGFLWISNN